ncbi:MAG: Rrf2 family transcriptional regulator [Hyphomicrobiales bacterium]
MRLTRFSDYSLRVLIHVGTRGDRLSTIDEIAGSFGISRNHVMKVVQRLSSLGYLETLRGKGGGMRLACDPARIGIGRLIRQTEEDMNLVECFQGGGACAIEPVCALKLALSRALTEFLKVLDEYTLADLIRPRKRLAELLQLEA